MSTVSLQRSVHLVDIENLLGSPRPMPDEVDSCRAQYEALAAFGDEDLAVVACNHGAALSVGCAWPRARLLVGSGPNGADLALLKVIETEALETRFGSIVLGSGDGIFAEATAQLATHGARVTVISRPEALSRSLRLAASDVRYLLLPPAPPQAGDWDAA